VRLRRHRVKKRDHIGTFTLRHKTAGGCRAALLRVHASLGWRLLDRQACPRALGCSHFRGATVQATNDTAHP
jgi:hypothetical protein